MKCDLLNRWDQWCLHRIFSAAGFPKLRLELPGGAAAGCPPEHSKGTIVIHSRAALLRMLFEPETGFGEGFVRGEVEVRGDLVGLLEAIYRAQRGRPRPLAARAISATLGHLQPNSLTGSRRNIRRHYDLGNDFFRAWLDRELVYTCAYFEEPGQSLEQAQVAKHELVCRKLRLLPGESVAEAGCGWGSFALHMARTYGVRVRAFNISHEQIVFARELARQEGLEHMVEFVEDDYRNMSGQFDVFTSIGMLEHVGAHHYEELGAVIHRAIGDRGRGLLHFIGRSQPAPLSAWTRANIFPGASVLSLGQAARIFEPWNITIVGVDNLRPHYERTALHWLRRFEAAMPDLSRCYDAPFLRAWRLHHAGSVTAFRTGTLQLFQILFAASDCDDLPQTRALTRHDLPQQVEAAPCTSTTS